MIITAGYYITCNRFLSDLYFSSSALENILLIWFWLNGTGFLFLLLLFLLLLVSLFVTGPLMDECDYLRRFDLTQF